MHACASKQANADARNETGSAEWKSQSRAEQPYRIRYRQAKSDSCCALTPAVPSFLPSFVVSRAFLFFHLCIVRFLAIACCVPVLVSRFVCVIILRELKNAKLSGSLFRTRSRSKASNCSP